MSSDLSHCLNAGEAIREKRTSHIWCLTTIIYVKKLVKVKTMWLLCKRSYREQYNILFLRVK